MQDLSSKASAPPPSKARAPPCLKISDRKQDLEYLEPLKTERMAFAVSLGDFATARNMKGTGRVSWGQFGVYSGKGGPTWWIPGYSKALTSREFDDTLEEAQNKAKELDGLMEEARRQHVNVGISPLNQAIEAIAQTQGFQQNPEPHGQRVKGKGKR